MKVKSKIKELTTETQVATTGIFNIFGDTDTKNITPAKVAKLLRDGQNNIVPELLAIAELMEERDPHYASVLGTRKRAVLGIDYTLVPSSNEAQDEKIAQAVTQMLNNINIYDLFEDLLDAIGKGFSVVEIIWHYDKTNELLSPSQLLYCDPRLFVYDKSGRNLNLISDTNISGISLPPQKFIVHQAKLKSGKPCRDGVARTALWSWMIKNYTISDWVSFCESFGVPLRIGKYSAAATNEDKQTLLRAIRSLGRDSAAMMPESMNIEFNSAGDVRGNATVFSDLARYVDEQLSKLILGQTMTTDNGSSQAQATVHNDVRRDIIISDARKLADTITNQLIRYFVELNFGVNYSLPKFQFNTDEAQDISALINDIVKLIPLGLEVSGTEIKEKLGLRALEKNEVPLQSQYQQKPALNKNNSCECGCQSKAKNKPEYSDLSEEQMIQAMVDATNTDEPFSIPIKQALNESKTFKQFQNKLPTIIQGILNSPNATALNEKTAKALFTSRLNGYVQENNNE